MERSHRRTEVSVFLFTFFPSGTGAVLFFLKKNFHLPPRLFDCLLFPLPLPPSLFDSPLSPGVNLLFSFRGEEAGLTLVFLPYLRKAKEPKVVSD